MSKRIKTPTYPTPHANPSLNAARPIIGRAVTATVSYSFWMAAMAFAMPATSSASFYV